MKNLKIKVSVLCSTFMETQKIYSLICIFCTDSKITSVIQFLLWSIQVMDFLLIKLKIIRSYKMKSYHAQLSRLKIVPSKFFNMLCAQKNLVDLALKGKTLFFLDVPWVQVLQAFLEICINPDA